MSRRLGSPRGPGSAPAGSIPARRPPRGGATGGTAQSGGGASYQLPQLLQNLVDVDRAAPQYAQAAPCAASSRPARGTAERDGAGAEPMPRDLDHGRRPKTTPTISSTRITATGPVMPEGWGPSWSRRLMRRPLRRRNATREAIDSAIRRRRGALDRTCVTNSKPQLPQLPTLTLVGATGGTLPAVVLPGSRLCRSGSRRSLPRPSVVWSPWPWISPVEPAPAQTPSAAGPPPSWTVPQLLRGTRHDHASSRLRAERLTSRRDARRPGALLGRHQTTALPRAEIHAEIPGVGGALP